MVEDNITVGPQTQFLQNLCINMTKDSVVLCTTYEHCPLRQPIKTTHLKKSCASFFVRLTTLNDARIHKDLLLTKFVPSNIPAYLILL